MIDGPSTRANQTADKKLATLVTALPPIAQPSTRERFCPISIAFSRPQTCHQAATLLEAPPHAAAPMTPVHSVSKATHVHRSLGDDTCRTLYEHDAVRDAPVYFSPRYPCPISIWRVSLKEHPQSELRCHTVRGM